MRSCGQVISWTETWTLLFTYRNNEPGYGQEKNFGMSVRELTVKKCYN